MLLNVVHAFGSVSPISRLTAGIGIAVLALAVSYVFRPTEQKLVLMRPVSLATIFATVSGLLGGWISILSGVAATASGELPSATLWRAIGESLIVGFVCFGLLAAAWLLVAVGIWRRGVANA